MLLIIDNYDSFTFNLVHYFLELGAKTRVVRNDELTVAQALSLRPNGIVLSPGPCAPDTAGICLDLIRKAPAEMPILGVCLGHQAMGQAFGGDVIAAKEIMHGKTSPISHDGTGLFSDIPNPFIATRYHSLAIKPESFPAALRVTARTADGEIMGLCHTERPIHGVQFHPESIASEHGHHLLRNFLNMTEDSIAIPA
ncbi:MAG: aminodeoxychorismate/anthranilate synthase component II [Maricaulis sp.]|nr:aminodeoxychorismate/anthranilate synthase component II [Maricaulis sp.]MDG2043247.1 aminodeoxychorismate/anthranilate synthase component II [Maricaulis sp.]